MADPATGVAVYDSTGSGGWTVYGGTSVSSPLIAGMYAEANNPAPSAAYLYAAGNATGLNDVTTGQNKSSCSSYLCKAGVGYDGPTGMGTPNGVLALGGTGAVLGGGGSGGGTTSSKFSMSLSASSGSVADGGSTTATVSTATTSGSAQSVALSVSGLPSGVTASFNPTSVTSGSSSALTLSVGSDVAAGSYPLTITGTGSAGGSASATYTLTVTAGQPPAPAPRPSC